MTPVPPAVRVGYAVRRYPQRTQTFVHNEIAAITALGADVRVVSLLDGDAPPSAPTTVLRGVGGRPGSVPAALRFLGRRPLRAARFAGVVGRLRGEFGRRASRVDVLGLVAVAEAWERDGVEVVHAHFAWEGAAAAMALSRLLDVPWSMTIHANDMYASRMHLERKLADADCVVTVCEYNRRRLREVEGYHGELPIVICGVEAPDVLRPGVPDGPPRVVAVGRLVEKKGVDLLLQAVAQVRLRVPDLRVDVVGDGPLEPELRALAEALGLGPSVTFHGSLDHTATLRAIDAATVFAAPYRIGSDGDRDSMPVAIKEAMVRGVAVVGATVAGVPEMLSDDCGVLVPVDDAPALASALEELLTEPARRELVASRGRERATERYLIGRTGQDMLEVLSDLAGRRAAQTDAGRAT